MQNNSESKPLVSIITICYNSAEFIEETIRSVLEQDYPNIEYIIVDGGSTDGTLGIIGRYEERISRWISEPDEGISDAMNKGIRMASGDVVGIIHSDDYYADSTVIGRVVDVFERIGDVKALYGIQNFIDPGTREVLLSWGRDEDPAEIKKRMYMPHPTVFCRRKVYDDIGSFRNDYKIAMDYEWCMRLTKYTRPYFLDYRIAVQRDSGASGMQYRRAFRESVSALWEHKYYLAAFMTVLRNFLKRILIALGLKGFLYRLWERNVRPL